uniref:Uncharacterized protein n=1 Tax=Branchiostoma floridae TaxID=7739 RepID=C3Y724_BRAFL|eukprot:XP_002608124.1 hypothetical protein BRAFLDRAFT_91398 [Branchiostoma floridae]
MGRKLRHLLIFLLIMMKEPNMPEADCTGVSSPVCTYRRRGLTSMEQVDIPTSVCHLELGSNRISSITSLSNLTNLTYLDLGRNLLTNIQQSTFSNQPKLCFLDLAANKIRSIQWYFRRNVGSIFGTDDTRRKVSMAVTPPPVTNTRHESGASVNQVVIISTAIGSLVTVTVAIAFIIWCKRSGKNLLTGFRNTKFAITNPIDTVMTNGQAGQGQSQANTNTTAMAEVSGHDNQYEDVDNQHNLKRQVRPHAITETKINTGEVAASGQYEDMNQHNKKEEEYNNLKRAVESLMQANEEKDVKIEELKSSLNRYKRVQDMVLSASSPGRKGNGISLCSLLLLSSIHCLPVV